MKNLKYFSFFILLLMMGCSDLEEEPIGLLAPEGFVQSPDDVQSLINGAIGNMATEAYWGRRLSHSLMLRGDMATIGDQGSPSRRREVNNFTMSADNGMVTSLWPKSYEIIAGANQAIASANTLNVAPSEIDPIKAQAHFIRAYTYYHLVRLFGGIPYLDSPVENLDEAKKIPKTSEADVYSNIISDLIEAKTFLPDVQSNRSYPSKATAAAYLASVYLTLGDYQKAYDEAKFVIDNEGRFNLGLEPDYQNLFNADRQNALTETLFHIAYNGQSDGDTGRDYTPALTGIRANEKGDIGGGWSVAVPTVEVYNSWDGRDYRKRVSLDTVGIFNGEVKWFDTFPSFDSRNIASAYIAKYTRFIGATADLNGRTSSFNYAQMRYAEVLLIAAEALNELSPGSLEAAGYVNRIRERARYRDGNIANFPPDVAGGLSKEGFRDMVLEERRLELSFEFKRWYDIKRRQLGTEAFGPNGLEPQPNFDPNRDYFFPLPADEIIRNPNLGPNNPGY